MKTGTHVHAIHHEGVLKLLTPLKLPEGAQVSVIVFSTALDQTQAPELARQTRLMPAKKLDNLTSLVAIGGDALVDSEALYD